MNDVERHAVFFIADISGYTKFIFSNEKEISHSQMVIRELITTMLEEVELPLQLIRIEGDALFFTPFGTMVTSSGSKCPRTLWTK